MKRLQPIGRSLFFPFLVFRSSSRTWRQASHGGFRTALVFIALLLAALAGCGPAGKVQADIPANAPHVAVVKAARRNLSSKLEIASELLPNQDIAVYAKVSGYIQKLYVNWGTHVKQGQLLAVLEIPELQQQLHQDEAAVRRSEQDLVRAQEELKRTVSAYKVAHLTYSRLEDVQKTQPNLVAQQEVDVSQGKDEEADAAVSAAKAARAAAEQAQVAAQAALAKNQAMYAYARITAPFEGVVTEISSYTGALLPAGTSSSKGDQALCHLSQNNLLRLVIPLPERAMADVHLGQSVSVEVSTLHKTLQGKIIRFSDQIDSQTRTMHTEVDIPNPKYELVPGMYATVSVPLHTIQNALSVPVQAVQETGENRGVALVVNAGNRIEKRDVTLGLQTPDSVEVLAGLKEDEMVVFGEQSQYKAGELVNPQIVTPQTVAPQTAAPAQAGVE